MKIIISKNVACIEDGGNVLATFAATGDVLKSAVSALALSRFFPVHLQTLHDEMNRAVNDYYSFAPALCRAFDSQKWEWARTIAPTLEIEYRS